MVAIAPIAYSFDDDIEMETNDAGEPETSCGPRCDPPYITEKSGKIELTEKDGSLHAEAMFEIRVSAKGTEEGYDPSSDWECLTKRCAGAEGVTKNDLDDYPSANPGFHSKTLNMHFEDLAALEKAIEEGSNQNAEKAEAVLAKAGGTKDSTTDRLKKAVADHNAIAKKVNTIPLPDPGPGNDDETEDPKDPANPHKTPKNSPYWEKINDSRDYAAYARAELAGRNDPDMALRLQGLDAADIANTIADQAYASNEVQVGDGFVDAAKQIVDTALSFAPVAGNIIAAYEAAYGVNPITGDSLSSTGRTIAFASIFLPFAGKGFKAVSRVFRRMKNSAIGQRMLAFIGKADGDLAKQGVPGDLGKVGDVADRFRAKVNSVFAGDKAFKHVTLGQFAPIRTIGKHQGTIGLESGMHTSGSFNQFIKMAQQSGGAVKQMEVPSFSATNELPRSVKFQELSNNVKRLQVSQDLWVNRAKFKSSIGKAKDGQTVVGAKTLFPSDWSKTKILTATQEVIAKNTPKGSRYIGKVDGVRIMVVVNESGKVISSYPTWTQ